MSFKVFNLTKPEIRKQAKALRRTLPLDAISAGITERLLAWPEFAKYRDVFLFHPLPGEIDLLGLMKKTDKNWYLPRVTANNQLAFHRYHADDDLYPSAFGVMEPSPNADMYQPATIEQWLVFVPGLAFDRSGGRLGYGKGYYDRFLQAAASSHMLSVGVAPAALVSDDPLPVDAWDKPVGILASEAFLLDLRAP